MSTTMICQSQIQIHGTVRKRDRNTNEDKHISKNMIIVKQLGLEVIKLFSHSIHLSMKFIMLINVKMPTARCLPNYYGH